ncbi:hypothetical protein ACLOJK_032929 [Asimina triloba]
MEALLPSNPIQGLRCCCHMIKVRGPPLRKRLRGGRMTAKAIGPQDRDYEEGRHSDVDESMVVLRKRIYELKMSEESFGMGEQQPHDQVGWMGWEKQYKASSAYNSDVCQAVGLLQTMLMNTRPILAIGMAGLVLLSVPAFVGMILLSLAHAAKGIFHGF